MHFFYDLLGFNLLLLASIFILSCFTVYIYELPNPNQTASLLLLAFTLNIIAVFCLTNITLFLTIVFDYVFDKILRNRGK